VTRARVGYVGRLFNQRFRDPVYKEPDLPNTEEGANSGTYFHHGRTSQQDAPIINGFAYDTDQTKPPDEDEAKLKSEYSRSETLSSSSTFDSTD